MAMAMTVTSTSHASSYDVFLSFRGQDTRYGFTGSLYKALTDKGIHTFIDEEELKRGEEITPALVKAIQGSKIAIIVLSKDYASSTFCLDELVTIIDCKTKGLLVIPVFCKVDPSDVRHLRGSYEDALTKHEKRSPEKLQKWKDALRKVADRSGYHLKEGDEYEYKFIESIVDLVSQKINHPASLHVADHPVGLESRVADVMKLLDVGSDDGVHMVGILGIGGIGKSTFARAVYNKLIAHNFDGFCYLENVREESEKHGLKHLQNILLQEILRDEKIKVTSVEQGASIIPQKLQGKKLLLVIDDVDKEEQLEKIVGSPEWFGPGSRVIVTTRDRQLLACHQVKRLYELKELDEKDALQLLTWKAFKEEKADPRYEDVLIRVLTYASGLPLALEVIGSLLSGKSIEDWESAINQCKRIPPKKIQDILKVSFDTLEEEEKSVFLDIACCMKGYGLKEVEAILSLLYDDSMKHHIGVLVDKSLIKVDLYGTITMHDLIQEMGRDIDHKESHKKPQKRNRLWLWKDIIEVLKQNKGASTIEIIYLDVPISNREETIEWDGNGFKEMKNLKVLIIKNGKFSEGPKCLPNSLRVLEWWGYPSNCLPSGFQPHDFVMCNLPNSCITSFELDHSSKMFESITVLKFDGCKSLTQIGDVSGLKNVEIFSFELCQNLVTVHESIGRLGKVKKINAKGCRNLVSFPPIHLTSLEQLDISTSGLNSFPEVLGGMQNIKRLQLLLCRMKEFPNSFVNQMFRNITSLEFYGCSSLAHIPDLSGFPYLEYLTFSDCVKLVTIHESIGRLGKLKVIEGYGCRNLVSFPPIHLTSLQFLNLSDCKRFEKFPEIPGKMENICELELIHPHIKCDSGSVVKLPELTSFAADYWERMKWVKEEENKDTMGSIVSSNLLGLGVACCNLDDDFFSIIGFTRFARVSELDLSGNNFTFLPECIKEFQSLLKFNVDNCKHLQEIRGVPPNILWFTAQNCESLSSSSIRMFINEELYEIGMRQCCLPGECIPEWFDHQSRELSTSFWFRNEPPTNILCLLIRPLLKNSHLYWRTPMVSMNGKKVKAFLETVDINESELDHTFIGQLHLAFDDSYEVALRKEWNHVEVTFVNVMETLDFKTMGIHVLKQESSKQDIRFTNPNSEIEDMGEQVEDMMEEQIEDMGEQVEDMMEEQIEDMGEQIEDMMEEQIEQQKNCIVSCLLKWASTLFSCTRK